MALVALVALVVLLVLLVLLVLVVLLVLMVVLVVLLMLPMCAAPARASAVVEVEVALVVLAVPVAAVGPISPVSVLWRPHCLAVAVVAQSAAEETVWGKPHCFEIFPRPGFAPLHARAARAVRVAHHCRSPTSLLLLHSPFARTLSTRRCCCVVFAKL